MEVGQYDAADSESVLKQQRQQKCDQLRLRKSSQDQLQKQTQLINDLSKSNSALREELAKADTTTFSASNQEKVIQLQSELDEIDMKIEYERMKKADVQTKHTNARQLVMKTRKSMGSPNAIYESTIAVDKQIKVLDNRLDQALRKFNEALSHNKSLRAQIDSLKEERRVFQRIYKKIEVELHDRKLAMADKIESANMDYEERDKLKQELDARKQIAEEDRKLCQDSFIQLDKVLEQLKQTSLEQKRQQMVSISIKPANNSTKNGLTVTDEDTANSPFRSKSRSKTTNRSVGGHSERGEASRDIPYDEEADLLAVVDDLKTLTGQKDLRLLHDNFVKAEQSNFSMYNYVNTLHAQEEELVQEIAQLKEEFGAERGDYERRAELNVLENELAAVELQQEKLDSDSAHHRHILAQVRNSTNELFVKVGCDKEEAVSTYGTDEVTDTHLPGFLGMLEQRVNELLFVYRGSGVNADAKKIKDQTDSIDENEPIQQTALSTDGYSDAVNSFIGVGPTTQPAAVTAPKIVKHVNLPSTNAGDNHSEDIAAGREEILSHEEMRQRVEHRIQRRMERMENRGKAGTHKKTRK